MQLKDSRAMRQQIGLLFQFVNLVGLPLLIYWQLVYGFHPIAMPLFLGGGCILFWLGTRLRES